MQSLVIQFSQIVSISKAEKMKLINKHNIKVKLSDGGSYSFKRLKSRDETIGIIIKLWQESKGLGANGTTTGNGANTSEIMSSISPGGQVDSAFTIDSALKGGEDEDTEDSGEDDKNPGANEEGGPEGVAAAGDPFYAGEDDGNLRDPTDEELNRALSQIPLPDKHFEIGHSFYNFGVNEYFELF
jgi:VAD1 Analog of StAR-related lipid transfer domain